MSKDPLVLGIDLGTSGVRIALINSNYELIHFSSSKYSIGLQNCEDWKNSCSKLIKSIPSEQKARIIACSIDGTSGTLIEHAIILAFCSEGILLIKKQE